jgi:hypothetical protein
VVPASQAEHTVRTTFTTFGCISNTSLSQRRSLRPTSLILVCCKARACFAAALFQMALRWPAFRGQDMLGRLIRAFVGVLEVFFSRPKVAMHSATTLTEPSSSSSRANRDYAELRGESVIHACRNSPSRSRLSSEEQRLIANAPPISGVAGPSHCARTILPHRRVALFGSHL